MYLICLAWCGVVGCGLLLNGVWNGKLGKWGKVKRKLRGKKKEDFGGVLGYWGCAVLCCVVLSGYLDGWVDGWMDRCGNRLGCGKEKEEGRRERDEKKGKGQKREMGRAEQSRIIQLDN